MSVYIYCGEDIYRIEEGLKLLLTKRHIDADHTVTIDASDKRSFTIESVLVECDSFSLFDDECKAVIVKNPFFLSSSSKEAEKPAKHLQSKKGKKMKQVDVRKD